MVTWTHLHGHMDSGHVCDDGVCIECYADWLLGDIGVVDTELCRVPAPAATDVVQQSEPIPDTSMVCPQQWWQSLGVYYENRLTASTESWCGKHMRGGHGASWGHNQEDPVGDIARNALDICDGHSYRT